MGTEGYRFGLEGEYLLVESSSFRPLWHGDLTFRGLNALLESIDFEPLLEGLPLEGLELDPPHRKLMPYYVEGYTLANQDLTTYVDVLPKGIEIRTPVCPSLETCLQVYENLYQGLQRALGEAGYRAIGLAHHPVAGDFQGPQNHKRHDWWQWALRVTTTYGPDLNLSLPQVQKDRFDWEGLQRRANYYGPALVAFSLNAPVLQGTLWRPRGRQGLSVRTYRRSPFGPMLAYHPKESGRLEFKSLDMPTDRRDFHSFFLLWLWLVADTKAPGQADDQDRIYDLGALARLGWEAEQITGRAEEVLDRSEVVLAGLGLDPSPLGQLRQRLARRWVPADALIRQVEADPSVSNLLRYLDAIAATRDVPQLACEDLSSGNGRSESHWDIDEESTHEVDYAREGEGGPGRLSLAHQEVRGHRR
jgi:carboxylate-amine ligase